MPMGFASVVTCEACGKALPAAEYLSDRLRGARYLCCAACRFEAYRRAPADMDRVTCSRCGEVDEIGKFLAWGPAAPGELRKVGPAADGVCSSCRRRARAAGRRERGEVAGARPESVAAEVLRLCTEEPRGVRALRYAVRAGEPVIRAALGALVDAGKLARWNVTGGPGRPAVVYGAPEARPAAEAPRAPRKARRAPQAAPQGQGASIGPADVVRFLPGTAAEVAERAGVGEDAILEVLGVMARGGWDFSYGARAGEIVGARAPRAPGGLDELA